MRRILKVILMLVIHFLIFVSIHEIGVRLAPILFNTSKSSLHWGVTVRYSIILFGIIAFILSIIQEYSKSRRIHYISLFFACLIFSGYYFTDFKYTPFRTTLLIFSGVLGLLLPTIAKWRYFNANPKS